MLTVTITYDDGADNIVEVVRTKQIVRKYSSGAPMTAVDATELVRQALDAFKGAVNA